MVPSMTTPDKDLIQNQNTENTEHHHHNHDHKCACHTLKELGMVYYDPPQKKSGLDKGSTNTNCPHHRQIPNEGKWKESKPQNHRHNHDPDHKCACRTLEELGMVWHEPRPKKSGSAPKHSGMVPNEGKRTVTAELHSPTITQIPTVEEILTETMKEIRIGKDSINQRFQTTSLYKPLESNDDIPDDYPHMQKANASNRKQNDVTAGPRYVPLLSTSRANQHDIELDFTEVNVEGENMRSDRLTSNDNRNISIEPFFTPYIHHHHLQAESDNDKNHLKTVKGFSDNNKKQKNNAKDNTRKVGNSPKKPKHRRSIRQRAERKFRKYTVPKGYHKLREDVDDDIIQMEQDMNIRKERRKQLKKVSYS